MLTDVERERYETILASVERERAMIVSAYESMAKFNIIKAYETYAAKLGITVDALSDDNKKQAVMDAILKEMK